VEYDQNQTFFAYKVIEPVRLPFLRQKNATSDRKIYLFTEETRVDFFFIN
jgi:hypothetical protein